MLDTLIDRMLARSRGPVHLGSFSRWGSVFNVVVCSALIVFSMVNAFVTDSSFAAVTLIAVPMEILFIRILVRVYRGDFDGL